MAKAVLEGASQVDGTEAVLRRVPELVPEAAARAAGFKLDQSAPVATVEELVDFDAIIIGCGTRYGRMASQMASFLDQTGALWARGALNGKVGAAFTSTATQHGGQETTLHGRCRTAVFVCGTDDAGRDHRRQPLWRLDHRGRPGTAPAQPQ
jgi:NAD(P)H dehydrogenase (quinone)